MTPFVITCRGPAKGQLSSFLCQVYYGLERLPGFWDSHISDILTNFLSQFHFHDFSCFCFTWKQFFNGIWSVGCIEGNINFSIWIFSPLCMFLYWHLNHCNGKYVLGKPCRSIVNRGHWIVQASWRFTRSSTWSQPLRNLQPDKERQGRTTWRIFLRERWVPDIFLFP